MVNILCAESVVFGKEIFSSLGSVTVVSDQEINQTYLAQQDCLIIRSKTKVTQDLLKDRSIKFIGTATAGIDHIDPLYEDICFSAKGSNAASVAEYVMAALHYLDRDISFSGKTLGIIGYGHVGSTLARYAEKVGMRILANDPPLEEAGTKAELASLERIFQEADFLSLHIPLVKDGKYPTQFLADKKFFQQFKKPIVFINSARGNVVDEASLEWAIRQGIVTHSVLDVWQNEPAINQHLLGQATIATAHIAGYSWPGRIKGTLQVYEQLCEFLGQESRWTLDDFYSPTGIQYDIAKDSHDLKELQGLPEDQFSKAFNRLRREYGRRDEIGLEHDLS